MTHLDDTLVASDGARYPVIDGVPVLLRSDVRQTIHVATASIESAARRHPDDPAHLATLGLSSAEVSLLRAGPIDDMRILSALIPATNGLGFKSRDQQRPPIPDFPLTKGSGRLLLDIGCNWGRWTIAAAQAGFTSIGIDPSLGAVLAATRLAKKMGVDAHFVCGDARFLPFRNASIETVFSYSVFQHFSSSSVRDALVQIDAVLTSPGHSLIQMARSIGVRSLYHQAKRRFREPVGFEVRYWSNADILDTFSELVGPTVLEVDCFFGLGLQKANASSMTRLARYATYASEVMKRLTKPLPALALIADSMFIHSTRP